jgi:hypothetical protein
MFLAKRSQLHESLHDAASSIRNSMEFHIFHKKSGAKKPSLYQNKTHGFEALKLTSS